MLREKEILREMLREKERKMLKEMVTKTREEDGRNKKRKDAEEGV